MDTNETEGFFPERGILRARRLRARVDQPVVPAEARTWGTGMWVVLGIAVFLPMFANTIPFGWRGYLTPVAIAVIQYSLWLLLVACGLCVAVGIWRNFRSRAS